MNNNKYNINFYPFGYIFETDKNIFKFTWRRVNYKFFECVSLLNQRSWKGFDLKHNPLFYKL